MAKKDSSPEDAKKADDRAFQDAIEEKVRQMMDPTAETTAVPESKVKPIVIKSAPELPMDDPNGGLASEVDELKAADPEADEVSAEDVPAEPVPGSEIEPDEAVDDIVVHEADDLLAADDEKLAKAFTDKKPSLKDRIKDLFSRWWNNPKARWGTIVGLALLVLSLFAVPSTRYFILNTAGIRSSASLLILDESTQLPLRNVQVSISGQTGTTDKDGTVQLTHLRLGSHKLIIEKRAFAPLDSKITIGWGSNPLGDFSIKPVGSQYTFVLTDYLSGTAVEGVEATSGLASALSNAEGVLKLTLEPDESTETEVIIEADGYRQETVTLNLDTSAETAIQLVPARKHVFVSKRAGKYDVYKIDADGNNEELVLAGSGTERDDLVLAPHPTEELVALVSTRENVRNSSGFLLSTLTVIDLDDNSTTKVAQSERVQVIDWISGKLVYVQIAEGASAANPKRHRLMSYDPGTGESKELAASNYFNDVIAVGNSIYYAPSSAYTSEKVGLFKIGADGSGKVTAHAQEVWNIYRTAYDTLVLATPSDWQEYKIADGKTTRLNGEPANLRSRVYVDSPGRYTSLWVDQRDGKGVLLAYDVAKEEDKQLIEQSGLNNPVRWLNDSAIVYRVSTGEETADYVMSLNGGEPKKLRDVTNTAGVDRWYYY